MMFAYKVWNSGHLWILRNRVYNNRNSCIFLEIYRKLRWKKWWASTIHHISLKFMTFVDSEKLCICVDKKSPNQSSNQPNLTCQIPLHWGKEWTILSETKSAMEKRKDWWCHWYLSVIKTTSLRPSRYSTKVQLILNVECGYTLSHSKHIGLLLVTSHRSSKVPACTPQILP